MNENRRIQTAEESLNWISYNLKRIADMLEQMNGIQKPSQPPRQQQHKSWGGNYQNNNQQNDVPF